MAAAQCLTAHCLTIICLILLFITMITKAFKRSSRRCYPTRNYQVNVLAPAGAPRYWLNFDGSDDAITLPAGEGSEPSTALTIEAWIKIAALDGVERVIVSRGTNYNQGYTLSIEPKATGSLGFRLCLGGIGYISQTAVTLGAWPDSPLPTHVCASWDGTTIRYFLNGVLVAAASASGSISYTGTAWQIGKTGGQSWKMTGAYCLLRISDVCRYTASFEPPADYTPDAHTVALYKCTDDGTTLTDSGPGAHHGTFKAAGEPAIGDAFSVAVMAYGDKLWSDCLQAIPAITDVDVYVERVTANAYRLHRKIHADGEWAFYTLSNAGGTEALLNLKAMYVGLPDPLGDDPSLWTTLPETQLTEVSCTQEYAFYGKRPGGSDTWWGNGHGNEVKDSESWFVDDEEVTLSDEEFLHGDEIKFIATSHLEQASVRVADLSKTLTLSKSLPYLKCEYRVTWKVDFTAATIFTCMLDPIAAALPKVNFISGGTAYDLSGASEVGKERSNAIACWNDSNEAILAAWTALWDGARNVAAGKRALVTQSTTKAYITRSTEISGALTDAEWTWESRYMALDGCGSHFLKGG